MGFFSQHNSITGALGWCVGHSGVPRMAAHVGFSIYLSMQMHFYTNKSMQSIASDGLQRDEHVNMRDEHVNMRDERVKLPPAVVPIAPRESRAETDRNGVAWRGIASML